MSDQPISQQVLGDKIMDAVLEALRAGVHIDTVIAAVGGVWSGLQSARTIAIASSGSGEIQRGH